MTSSRSDDSLDLTRCCPLDAYANAKRLPVEFLNGLGVEEFKFKGRKAIRTPYCNPDGSLLRYRYRTALKRAEQEKDHRFIWDPRLGGTRIILYGLERLPASGELLILVEGESDAQTLWHHRFYALGVPGATNFKPSRDDEFLGRFTCIVAVQEPGAGGDAFVCRLLESAHRRRICIARLDGFKDVSRLHIDDPGLFKERLAAAIAAAVALDDFLKDDDMGPTDKDADYFDELVDKAAADPGAPFAPKALSELLALKKSDPARYEAIRARLKAKGVRVTALDRAIARKSGKHNERKPTQADLLTELACTAELFHAPDDTGYADVRVNGHRETHAVRSKDFKQWLARSYYEKTGGAPGSEALQAALNVIDANARWNGETRQVHVRVAEQADKMYLDLADAKWQAVEIDTAGWNVISAPPVRFRRTAGMKPLPEPAPGGSIKTLRSFLNVKSEGDFVLVVAWLLAALRSGEPYPLLALYGEQGSAKSTFSRILKHLIDPRTPPTEVNAPQGGRSYHRRGQWTCARIRQH